MMQIPRKPVGSTASTSQILRDTSGTDNESLHQSRNLHSASNTRPTDDSTTETTSLTSDKTKRKKLKIEFSEHSWALGILALSLSIAALLTVTALLLAYDEKPLATWSFFLTFNTIISALGTVSRTTLAFTIGACLSQWKWNWFKRNEEFIINYDRFEEAGRGPLGSVRLLWGIRLR
ncbi:hypothetical protein CSAL01_04015 [Colletotrichum salicis]|uniref:Uncharacterized protein n=1 Tax=Colletotrichum salicis TaxID=1209931 RepID=A0A135UVN1_9PEZI|nr:hypothetical protein CSAL01_04015 [Colletotrichum salicis]